MASLKVVILQNKMGEKRKFSADFRAKCRKKIEILPESMHF